VAFNEMVIMSALF